MQTGMTVTVVAVYGYIESELDKACLLLAVNVKPSDSLVKATESHIVSALSVISEESYTKAYCLFSLSHKKFMHSYIVLTHFAISEESYISSLFTILKNPSRVPKLCGSEA